MFLGFERGSALLLTIVVILVLLVLGGALGMSSLVERVQVEREINDMQAYYLARSGAEAIELAMHDYPKLVDSLVDAQSEVELEGLGAVVIRVLEPADTYPQRTIQLIATGLVGRSEQVFSTTVKVNREFDIILPPTDPIGTMGK